MGLRKSTVTDQIYRKAVIFEDFSTKVKEGSVKKIHSDCYSINGNLKETLSAQ